MKGNGKFRRLQAAARPRRGGAPGVPGPTTSLSGTRAQSPPLSPDGTENGGLWPENLSAYRQVASLGGSTGARLVEDGEGLRYVMKRGGGADPSGHLMEEAHADDAYRALGLAVPESKIYEGPGGEPVKVARFVSGKTLKELEAGGEGERAARVREELKKGFAADALLGNWDVVGLEHDNVILDDFGTVYRVDNGGSLRRRAMGTPKPPGAWSEKVGELHSMRDPTRKAGAVFAGLPDSEVTLQVKHRVLPARKQLLRALPQDLRGIVNARIDHLEAWAASNPS